MLLLHRLVCGCAFIGLATSVLAGDFAGKGVLEGHLKIFPVSDVNLADDATAAQPEIQKRYSEYPIIIRSPDTQKEVARVIADANGNYRVPLPPGDYILDIDKRERGNVRAKPRLFTIVSNQSVRVDISIDTGIR